MRNELAAPIRLRRHHKHHLAAWCSWGFWGFRREFATAELRFVAIDSVNERRIPLDIDCPPSAGQLLLWRWLALFFGRRGSR